MATAPSKKAANRLVVEEATNDDNSTCMLHPATMERLSLFHGDVVLLKGKRRRTTVCVAFPDDACEEHKMRINKVVRSNLLVRIADVVSVHQCPSHPGGRHRRGHHRQPLRLLPQALLPGRLPPGPQGRPLPRHLVHGGMRGVEFKVVEIDPAGKDYCIVAGDT
jgi:transitional endoplasmic reticulum ATPase